MKYSGKDKKNLLKAGRDRQITESEVSVVYIQSNIVRPSQKIKNQQLRAVIVQELRLLAASPEDLGLFSCIRMAADSSSKEFHVLFWPLRALQT